MADTAPAASIPEYASPIVAATAAFVREALKGSDGSHDWHHIARVHRVSQKHESIVRKADCCVCAVQMALRLAKDEGVDADTQELVEVCC